MEKKSQKIEADIEFIDVLDKLEAKIKQATWDGVEKISKRTLTRILARKINSSKLL
jgi:hypothetical protein